jgi:hypothetical protein
MHSLACHDDLLVQLLNERGYHPIVLPRSNLTPPELYIFDDDRLKRWGPLAPRVPKGSLPREIYRGKLAAFEHKQTSDKHAKGAASFLETALQCIGVGGAPKVDLSIASGMQVTFSFEDTTYCGVDPSDVAAALQKGFDASAFPAEQIRFGMVHVAYEYAYARHLLMTIGGNKRGSATLTAAQLASIVDVGVAAQVSLVDGSRFGSPGRGNRSRSDVKSASSNHAKAAAGISTPAKYQAWALPRTRAPSGHTCW